MVTQAQNRPAATCRTFYPLAAVDFGLALYFAQDARETWGEALRQISAHHADAATLFASAFLLVVVGGLTTTGGLVLTKRWYSAAVGQAIITFCVAAYTGMALLWLLVFAAGKHQDPQKSMILVFALLFAILLSLVDTRKLLRRAACGVSPAKSP